MRGYEFVPINEITWVIGWFEIDIFGIGRLCPRVLVAAGGLSADICSAADDV